MKNHFLNISSIIGCGIGVYFVNYDIKASLGSMFFCFICFNYKFLENILMKYMSFIIFLLLGLCFYFISFDNLEKNKDIFYIIGGLIAFWYGYKKYERDKELSMFDKYLIGDLTIENINQIKKWIFSYNLYRRGYISSWLWEIINKDNGGVFINFLKEELSKKPDEEFVGKLVPILYYDLDFKKHIEKIIDDYNDSIDEKINPNLKYNLKIVIDGKKLYESLK